MQNTPQAVIVKLELVFAIDDEKKKENAKKPVLHRTNALTFLITFIALM